MNVQKKSAFYILFTFFSILMTTFGFSDPYKDVIIITTNNESQSTYWQSFFDEKNKKDDFLYIVLFEDWEGGADNGLGSLYAYKQAHSRALNQYDLDLSKVIEEGGRVSLFHCAGIGKRLYPLTASEYNNKSAIKLPSGNGEKSILELVLDQTLKQSDCLKGRFSVFWGDQIFKTSEILSPPKCHVEVLSKVCDFPTAKEWKKKNLDSYGLIIINSDGSSKLVEKTNYSGLNGIVGEGNTPQIGVSLGSFSITGSLLNMLMKTFDFELCNKLGQLNTDYHFWMPFTWSKAEYCNFMIDKGENLVFASEIYERMQMVKNHLQESSEMPVFGVQNIGEHAHWWDFGNLKCYYNNLISLLDYSSESGRELFKILELESHYDEKNNSIVLGCDIKKLNAKNSVIMNVTADSLDVEDAIVINSKMHVLNVEKAIVYNCEECTPCRIEPTEVRADIFFEQKPKHIKCYTHFTRNNKHDWEVTLPKNMFSFYDIYHMNEKVFDEVESEE